MTYLLVQVLKPSRFPGTSKYSIYRIDDENYNIPELYVHASVVLVHDAYYSVLSRLRYYTTNYQYQDSVFAPTIHQDSISKANIVFAGKWEDLPGAIQAQLLIDKL